MTLFSRGQHGLRHSSRAGVRVAFKANRLRFWSIRFWIFFRAFNAFRFPFKQR